MLATIDRVGDHTIALFDRHLQHPVDQVWAMLTDNEKLQLWFDELRIEDLRQDGIIKFDMQDGTFIDMRITDFATLAVLEFTWGEDIVRFELHVEEQDTQLILKETITKITEQTTKDLAGWHVCLDVIAALLDGRIIENRLDDWRYWYDKYGHLIQHYSE